MDENGVIVRNRARLIAQGLKQRELTSMKILLQLQDLNPFEYGNCLCVGV